LNVGQTATVNIVLEVGNVSEQITVTGEAPLVDTATANRGAVIDNQQVTELPLNGRNPFMLSSLAAGVNFNGALIYPRPFDNGAIAQWSINGSLAANNDFMLDGAPNNAQSGTNNIALVPPVDAVQEFKVMTNSYDAQYGHSGGGVINVSLKSGTNSFHGTAYEFARRNAWDANSFQNNAAGAARTGHYLDQYGAQAGGPVYIPKVYDGRDKSFFMVNYEGYREGTRRCLAQVFPRRSKVCSWRSSSAILKMTRSSRSNSFRVRCTTASSRRWASFLVRDCLTMARPLQMASCSCWTFSSLPI
jgi:hypothetical protein